MNTGRPPQRNGRYNAGTSKVIVHQPPLGRNCRRGDDGAMKRAAPSIAQPAALVVRNQFSRWHHGAGSASIACLVEGGRADDRDTVKNTEGSRASPRGRSTGRAPSLTPRELLWVYRSRRESRMRSEALRRSKAQGEGGAAVVESARAGRRPGAEHRVDQASCGCRAR